MPGGLPDVSQKFTAESSGYSAAIAAMIRDNEGLIKSIGDAQRKIAGLKAEMGGLGDRRIKVEVTGVDEAIGKVAALRKELDGLGDRHVHLGGDNGAMLRELRDISASMDMVSSSLGRMEDHMVVMKRDLADSSADLQMQTQMLRDNADAHHAAATAVSALAAARGGGGGGDRYYIRTGGGGGGGGGGGSRGGSSGGSGGGGDLPGGSGAFVPWRGGGFQAVKFWGMAIAEFAATAVPALIAAGSAAAVGMQGAQDVMIRAKAISAASESIGPAFGQSTSSYLGLPGYLSQAQDAARGGVYELAGAGINFARMGKGTFSQMGTSTLSMIDRGTANMLINYQKRQAAGGGMGDLLGGGTEWLRRYGDLFSNLGSTVMNLAPYEPGIGGDVLQSLVGGTGFLKQATQDIPGPILGAVMAAEGGGRWGKAVLGGKGLLGRVLGLGKVKGIGGLLGKAGGFLAERAPLGSAAEGLGFGLSGIAGGLEAFGGPLSIAAALSAYGMSYLASTMPSAAQRRVAGLQAGVNQAGFSAAFSPLAHAIVTTRGLAASGGGGLGADMIGTNQSPGSFMRFGPIGPTTRDVYSAAATGFTQTMTDLIGAGPQLVTALKKAGLKSVSMGEAFQIAQNALLDTSHAFGKNGKLKPEALKMLSDYVSGVGPMTRSGGGFNAAIEAGQIMSSDKMKLLSQVNQSSDAMTQIMTGGPAGMATLFGMLGGTPTTTKHGGLKLQASPGMAKMAQALTSFTTPGGAAAWNTFAGSQGFIAAEQQNLDQLRTAMTLGAIGQRGAAGLAGFQIQQMLPMAKKSPAALAMLMQQEQQMGIGGYYDPAHPGESQAHAQARNYQDAVKATAQIADNRKQADAATNHEAVALSRLPQVAKQFSQGFNADVMSQNVAKAATAMNSVISGAGKGRIDTSGIQSLVSGMKQAGLNAQAIGPIVQHALQQAHVSGAMQRKIMLQVGADTGPAQGKINSVHGKNVDINIMTKGAQAAQAAMNAIHGKTVTVTVVERVVRDIINLTSNVASTYGGGLGSLPGGPAGMRLHHQAGYRVPGYGGGDIVPAMLEPGEAVVPKHLVPALSGFLGAHSVPGFAAGGVAGSSVLGFASMMTEALNGPQVRESLRSVIDGLIAAGMPRTASYLQAQGAGGPAGGGPSSAAGVNHAATQALHGLAAAAKGPGGQHFSVEILKGIAAASIHGFGMAWSSGSLQEAYSKALRGHLAAAAAGAAKSMVAHIQAEVAYAKQTSANLTAGLNFGGMDTTQGPVQTQMKSYADSLKTFSGDIKAMSKGGLNKSLLRQMIAAGPVQGDALAQSIQQGPGGIKAVNSLYASIQKMSKGIGAQAAGAIYGGTLAPNLKSGTFVNNNVSISVNLSGGKGGGDLQLSNAQISQLVSLIQKKLLQQAKRNNKTGVKLPGKGS